MQRIGEHIGASIVSSRTRHVQPVCSPFRVQSVSFAVRFVCSPFRVQCVPGPVRFLCSPFRVQSASCAVRFMYSLLWLLGAVAHTLTTLNK